MSLSCETVSEYADVEAMLKDCSVVKVVVSNEVVEVDWPDVTSHEVEAVSDESSGWGSADIDGCSLVVSSEKIVALGM